MLLSILSNAGLTNEPAPSLSNETVAPPNPAALVEIPLFRKLYGVGFGVVEEYKVQFAVIITIAKTIILVNNLFLSKVILILFH